MVPPTTPRTYISGMYALNICAPEDETGGDWHGDIFYWHEGAERERVITLAGDGTPMNTNPIYGDYGVYEGKNRVVKMGLRLDASVEKVFIANHYRAILDLLYGSIAEYGKVYELTGATDDWLDNEKQKMFLLKMAAKMRGVFDGEKKDALERWICGELTPSKG
jgi:hypothetical protein